VQRRFGGVDVFLHAECGELRSHRDADHTTHAGRREFSERVFDERAPVPHADTDRDAAAESCPERGRLCERDIGERGAPANRGVVVLHLGDELGRGRPSAAHEPQVLRHLVD